MYACAGAAVELVPPTRESVPSTLVRWRFGKAMLKTIPRKRMARKSVGKGHEEQSYEPNVNKSKQ